MNILYSSPLHLLTLFLLGSGSAFAEDQTTTFSPVTNWSGDYQINLTHHDMGAASVPTLQSFAHATYNNQWVMMAGRTNGLHSFTADGLTNFPPKYQNTKVWVVDPVTKQTWSRSISDASSGLSQTMIDGLSSTNTQFYQDNNALLVNGGYVYDSTSNNFTTYNTMSAINLPNLVDWVKGTDATLNANAVLQVEGQTANDNSYEGGFFQITGGGLHKLDDRYHLIFGQNFEGGYTPGSNGVYSSQVRSFDLAYDFANGTISSSNAWSR